MWTSFRMSEWTSFRMSELTSSIVQVVDPGEKKQVGVETLQLLNQFSCKKTLYISYVKRKKMVYINNSFKIYK